MENKDDELCSVGVVLWLALISDYSNEKYNAYMDHIRSCGECMRGLEIDGVIDIDEMERD